MTDDQALKLECTKATGNVQEAKVLYQWLTEEKKAELPVAPVEVDRG